jgi:hypothetical protein
VSAGSGQTGSAGPRTQLSQLSVSHASPSGSRSSALIRCSSSQMNQRARISRSASPNQTNQMNSRISGARLRMPILIARFAQVESSPVNITAIAARP